MFLSYSTFLNIKNFYSFEQAGKLCKPIKSSLINKQVNNILITDLSRLDNKVILTAQ